MKEALKVSSELDSIEHLPGELLYLGQIYENHYKDFDQAEHYYKQGYDHAMRYAAHGISLTGDRKDVVDAYVNLINKKRKSSVKQPVKPVADHFAFSQGKSWKQIKEIFHHQLIMFHSGDKHNSKQLAKKLGMPASTLYSIQDRLKREGYLLLGDSLESQTETHDLNAFMVQHQDLKWDEVNQIFEREMIHYLYEKYGYNKHRMSQILKLSYPSIISKTRKLTQVDDHLLQN